MEGFGRPVPRQRHENNRADLLELEKENNYALTLTLILCHLFRTRRAYVRRPTTSNFQRVGLGQ
jgi:hypothetical protein